MEYRGEEMIGAGRKGEGEGKGRGGKWKGKGRKKGRREGEMGRTGDVVKERQVMKKE